MSVPRSENERSCICVLKALILLLTTIFYWNLELLISVVFLCFFLLFSNQCNADNYCLKWQETPISQPSCEQANCIYYINVCYTLSLSENTAFSGTPVTSDLLSFRNIIANPVHFLLTENITRGSQGIII